MADETAPLTPHGELLEAARGQVSKREAAKRAGISEGRWRQVVNGVQSVGGGQTAPATPRRATLIAMAEAVGADADAVLIAAGMDPLQDGERYRSEARASVSHGVDIEMPDLDLVELRMDAAALGVSIVVKGPVRDRAELEETAVRLMSKMQERASS